MSASGSRYRQRLCALQTHKQLQSSSWLFSSHSTPPNSDSADEEIYVQNNRYITRCANHLCWPLHDMLFNRSMLNSC